MLVVQPLVAGSKAFPLSVVDIVRQSTVATCETSWYMARGLKSRELLHSYQGFASSG